MGALADKIKAKKEKKTSQKIEKEPKERKQKKSKTILQPISAPVIKILSNEQQNLKEQYDKVRYFIATHAYDTIMMTCRWCLTTYRTRYDLNYGNKYNKFAYDSEECKSNDAIMRGWKISESEEELEE